MNWLKNIWKQEPVAVTGAVSAILTLAAAFGLNLTGEQIGAIAAVLTALSALSGRSQVVPVRPLEELAATQE